MGSARPSVTKKQRELKKRERQQAKAERRAQRKAGVPVPDNSEEPETDNVVTDTDQPQQ